MGEWWPIGRASDENGNTFWTEYGYSEKTWKEIVAKLNKMPKWFRIKYMEIVDQLVCRVRASNDKIILPYERAIIDTGTGMSVISGRVVKDLSLEPIGKGTLKSATGEVEVDLYRISIILPGHVKAIDLKVRSAPIEKNGDDIIIGMDILMMGNLTVNNDQGYTDFTFVQNTPECDYSLVNSDKGCRMEEFPYGTLYTT